MNIRKRWYYWLLTCPKCGYRIRQTTWAEGREPNIRCHKCMSRLGGYKCALERCSCGKGWEGAVADVDAIVSAHNYCPHCGIRRGGRKGKRWTPEPNQYGITTTA